MKTHISNIKSNIKSNNIILYGKKKIIFISILPGSESEILELQKRLNG